MLRNSRFIPVFVIPVHMLINLFPGEYLSAVKGQILADFILPGCKQNLLFSVLYLLLPQIKPEISNCNRMLFLPPFSADMCLDPGAQFSDAKGLSDIVISPQTEPPSSDPLPKFSL